MEVDLLCSGSKGNCCLIRSQKGSILIDCGAPNRTYHKKALAAAGMDPADLDGILISHNHGDHISQLRYFAGVPVYSWCELAIEDAKHQPVPLERHPILPMVSFQIADFTITPVALSHDAGNTTGFIVEQGAERLVYITDTGYIRNDLLPFLYDAKYYIFEFNHDLPMLMETRRPQWLKQRIASDTGHMNNADAARVLCSLITDQTRQVVLAHLSQEANTPSLAMESFMERCLEQGISLKRLSVCAAGQNETVHFGTR